MTFATRLFPSAWAGLLLLLAWWLVGGASAWAARPYTPVVGDPLAEPWRWAMFPELSGLNAACVAEGSDGRMWFGSVDGVWAYDGLTWVFYSRPEGVYGEGATLAAGDDGRMWVGGRWGISEWKDGQWRGVFPGTGTRFGDVRQLEVGRDGALWAATAWGALRWQQEKWTLFTTPEAAEQVRPRPEFAFIAVVLLPEGVLAKPRGVVATNQPGRRHDLVELREDQSGRMWLGTAGGEILTWTPPVGAAPDGTWVLYNETDGLRGHGRPSILPLHDGSVWVTQGGQMNSWNGAGWTSWRLASAGLPEEGGTLHQTRDGVVWLSARYAVWARRDGVWRRYAKPEFPIPTARNFLLQTADGALWIGGPSTEIFRIDYQTPRWRTLHDLVSQWASAAGAQWFLHRDGRVVVEAAGQWTSYGVEDGVIDTPVALLGTRDGTVWVAGSHAGTAATARFAEGRWTRVVHDEFSWGVEWRGVLEAADGSVWFSAAVDSSGPAPHRAGLLQFRDGRWVHHHQPGRTPTGGNDTDAATLLPATQRPEPIGKFTALGEAPAGRIWAGRNILISGDGQGWQIFVPPPELKLGSIDTMFTTRERELWIGTRQYGALRYDGRRWEHLQHKAGLLANSVRAFTQTDDGSIWAATDRDVSRFDGRTWSADVLPMALNVPHDGGSLKAAPGGRLWINRFDPDWMRRGWAKAAPVDTATCAFWTVCHQYLATPPETVLVGGATEVSPPGNLSVFWSGLTPWRERRDAALQFSFRLDGGAWSAFTSDRGHAFFTLAVGPHRLEVRARDRDFNVDPTPAVLEFVVLPPVWQQGWFIGLMIVLGVVLVAQSVRVLRDRLRLVRANRVLAAEIEERHRAEEALRRLNLELDQRVTARTAQLEAANRELEAFSYSVSHDLRAPLRTVDGFSRILQEDHAAQLDPEGLSHLQRVRAGVQRMGRLIEDMLSLSRVTRENLRVERVDLAGLAREVAEDLAMRDPARKVAFAAPPEVSVKGDPRFLRVALENLLGNAWKFTARQPAPRVEFGVTEQDGRPVYFVRDNGAGFEMQAAARLFQPFRRLHLEKDFPGTGIGLATVRRIVVRHGGRVWAEGRVGEGATVFFTLGETEPVGITEAEPANGSG